MKTILVTGGLGFIGSHFVDLALSRGYKIINIDKVTYASNTNFNPPGEYTFIKQDIKDLEAIPYCQYIVHFAAESSVDASIANSDPFINSNVLGTYRLLELLKNKKIENMKMSEPYKSPIFLYIGTDEVYGDIKKGFFKETSPHNPSNPYASSKAAAEMFVKAYGRTFGLPYFITRTTNNYGERQHSEKLIPRCITCCINNEKIPIQGTGEYIRNWIYVKDNCDALMRVIEKGKVGETYNISSNEEYSTIEIVQMILNKFGKELNKDTVEFVANRSGQDIRYGIDCKKLKKNLKWAQQNTLDNTLQQIIDYYIKNGVNS